MNFLMNIFNSIISKKKIMVFAAAIAIAVIGAVFGLAPNEIKEAVADAPTLDLKLNQLSPKASPSPSPSASPNGK